MPRATPLAAFLDISAPDLVLSGKHHHHHGAHQAKRWEEAASPAAAPGAEWAPRRVRGRLQPAAVAAFWASPADLEANPGSSSSSSGEATATSFFQPPHIRSRGQQGSTATSFGILSFLLKTFGPKPETLNALYPKMADPLSIMWREDHNVSLDQGIKFGLSSTSKDIVGTNLFDLNTFGCYPGKFPGWGPRPSHGPWGPPLSYGKKWWKHPSFRFSVNVGLVGVHLEDLTTGEVRWDAIYNCHRTSKLHAYFYPIGGSHPFFQPDWCPAPNDNMAHKFLLRITNLSNLGTKPSVFADEIGRMYFTVYGPKQLANTYQYEAEKVGPQSTGNGLLSRIRSILSLARSF
mmetsp:Transcript_55086/g.131268  ORF Transcript_55086/g.131268 Transcript_55086/m.131268 type:complete len:347 (+) Transcript_55086:127-1167(+)